MPARSAPPPPFSIEYFLLEVGDERQTDIALHIAKHARFLPARRHPPPHTPCRLPLLLLSSHHVKDLKHASLQHKPPRGSTERGSRRERWFFCLPFRQAGKGREGEASLRLCLEKTESLWSCFFSSSSCHHCLAMPTTAMPMPPCPETYVFSQGARERQRRGLSSTQTCHAVSQLPPAAMLRPSPQPLPPACLPCPALPFLFLSRERERGRRKEQR